MAYFVIGTDRKRYGPYSREQVSSYLKEGRIDLRTLATTAEGEADRPLGEFPEFAEKSPPLATAPAPVPASPSRSLIPPTTALPERNSFPPSDSDFRAPSDGPPTEGRPLPESDAPPNLSDLIPAPPPLIAESLQPPSSRNSTLPPRREVPKSRAWIYLAIGLGVAATVVGAVLTLIWLRQPNAHQVSANGSGSAQAPENPVGDPSRGAAVPRGSLSSYTVGQRSALQSFLAANPKCRFLPEGSFNAETLEAARKQWGFGNDFTPYYQVGDFNKDGKLDFAVVLLSGKSTSDPESGMHIVIFNGVAEDKYEAVHVEREAFNEALFIRSMDTGLYTGIMETGAAGCFVPAGTGYIVEPCGSD